MALSLPNRHAAGTLALLLLAGTIQGCLYYTGVIRVEPPARPAPSERPRLSDESVDLVLQAVARVARDEALRSKRGFSKPFHSELLAYYASPEQISVSVWLYRDERSLDIRIRDINHTDETSYTRSIRQSIEAGIRAGLPDHGLSYRSNRAP